MATKIETERGTCQGYKGRQDAIDKVLRIIDLKLAEGREEQQAKRYACQLGHESEGKPRPCFLTLW
jgi:hypothetical protein